MLTTKTQHVVAHLHDRVTYTLHSRSLEFLLSLKTIINTIEYGVIVNKVYDILSFNQSSWMKPYVVCNTDLRQNDKHDVEAFLKTT